MSVERNQKPYVVLVVTGTLLATLVSSGMGCGAKSDLGRVIGRVTLDGTPVQGVIILFQPERRRPSSAWLNADGKFALQYNASSSGAVIGPQKVQLKVPADDQLSNLPHGVGTPTEIPEKFREPFQTVEVKAGRNVFNFDLKSE